MYAWAKRKHGGGNIFGPRTHTQSPDVKEVEFPLRLESEDWSEFRNFARKAPRPPPPKTIAGAEALFAGYMGARAIV